MSSSTEVSFIFPYLTTLEVVLGTGDLSSKFDVKVNDEKNFVGNQAMQVMNGLHVQQALNLFDRSILNLMIDRQMAYEEQRQSFSGGNHDDEYVAHNGLMLVIRHFR